jgi:hypothetical protein
VLVNKVKYKDLCEWVLSVKCCWVVIRSYADRSSWVRKFSNKLSRSVRSDFRFLKEWCRSNKSSTMIFLSLNGFFYCVQGFA